MGINLVGSVDRHVDRPGILGIKERDAVMAGELCGFMRRGNPDDAQTFFDALSQGEHDMAGCRAGSQPDNVTVVHILDGSQSCLAFERVGVRRLCHDPARLLICAATAAAPKRAVLSFMMTRTGMALRARL